MTKSIRTNGLDQRFKSGSQSGDWGTTCQLCEVQKQERRCLCFFYYYHKKIFVYIEQGTSSYRKLSDWLLPLDVDISQRVKEKKHLFHCRPLSKSGTSVYLLIVSIRAERVHNYMMGKTHVRKHAISLYFDQNLSCLSSAIKPSANVLPRPWMINTLSCNVLLMSHRTRASPLPGVSLL